MSSTTADSTINRINTVPDPETFYEKYVRQRTPVHLTSSKLVREDSIVSQILENPTILQYDPFLSTIQRIIQTYKKRCVANDHDDDDDDDFLEQYNNVEVEFRSPPSTASSTSDRDNASSSPAATTKSISFTSKPFTATMVRNKMPFHDVYQKIFVDRNEQFYMTTPTLPLTNIEGQPDIMTFVTKQILLHHDISEDDSDSHRRRHPYLPLRPKLFGNLVPMNVGNIWVGCAPQNNTVSSGLHHDYHDNLYCLIHGTKIIQLAPPESIYHMEMIGTLHTLHKNGRIVYKEQIDSTTSNEPDESTCPIRPDGALLSVETLLKLELRKEEIETELSKLSSDSNVEAKLAKDKMVLLEEELNMIEEQILDIEMVDDDELDDDDFHDDDESEEEGVFFGNTANKKAISSTERSNDDDGTLQPKPKRMRHEKDSRASTGSDQTKSNYCSLPPNFVKRYDTNKVSFQTITMIAGDALYIPAGWFHEVTSIGAAEGPDGLHMAINYWYHPPDIPSNEDDRSTNKIVPNFDQPYVSRFWQRDWDQRQLD